MAATWKSLIVFGILGAALLMIGVPADPCAILYSVEANAGRDSLRASFSVERVNVSSTGEQADSYSSWPSLSANGRFAAFSSVATNLVADDGNDDNDIFVHDRASGLTVRVSKSISGGDASGPSDFPSLSYSGQSVAFSSEADNLHPADPDDITDIFVHDMVSNATRLVSVSTTGQKANYECEEPRISGDGAAACWSSSANNLVPGDTNSVSDIFVHFRGKEWTVRVSVSAGGQQGDSFSIFPFFAANGRHVAFQSLSTNLVEGDTNGLPDIFVASYH